MRLRLSSPLLFLFVFTFGLWIGYLLNQFSFLQLVKIPRYKGSPTLEVTQSKYRRALDGVFVLSERDTNLTPYAVIIDNSADARPSSGLGKASIVYEAISESGITRFLAIFDQKQEIQKIGPVRSERSYFIDLAQGYFPLLVHSGGSPDALLKIKKGGNFIDLDEISSYGRFYFRDKRKPSPHNLYTSSELLKKALEFRGEPLRREIEPWLFKDDSPTNFNKNISVDYSTESYRASYLYDPKSNEYERNIGSEKIRAKNVVVMYADTFLIDPLRLGMKLKGVGESIICLDGDCKQGIWEKKSALSREKFFYKDESGKREVEFNPGPIWIEVAPLGRKVEIK